MKSKRARETDDSRQQGKMDDLKMIKGIGPGIEKELHTIGIVSFEQLAALTPTEIAARLRAAGVSADRIFKQDWIGQARRLAAQEQSAEAQSRSENWERMEIDVQDHQRYVTFKIELLLDQDNHVRRTRILHIQDGSEVAWAGWDVIRLTDFVTQRAMIGQTPSQIASPTQDETREIEPAAMLEPQAFGTYEQDALTDVRIEIDNVSISDSLVMEQTDVSQLGSSATEQGESQELESGQVGPEEFVEPERHTVEPSDSSEMPFGSALLHFSLAGSGAYLLISQQARYLVQIFTYELGTGQMNLLAGELQLLRPDKLEYTSSLQYELPEIGRYQILGTVLLPDQNLSALALGPLLTVVP